MKKKLLLGTGMLIAFSCFFTTASFAQKDSTLNQRVSKSFCDEFTKKDLSKIKPENLDEEMGLLIINVIEKYKDEISKEWKLSVDREEDMEAIGEKIGRDAALSCPAFRDYIVNNMDDIGDDDDEKTITGNFIGLQTGQFSYITLKSKDKVDKYWWFAPFPGANELIAKPDQFRSKIVSANYKELEIYNASLKKYEKIKVLTQLVLE